MKVECSAEHRCGVTFDKKDETIADPALNTIAHAGIASYSA